MKQRDKQIFYWAFGFCLLTGTVLFALEAFFEVQTAYGIQPHPARGLWLDLHLVSLPFMFISLGGLTFTHILPELKRKQGMAKRYTGIILTALFTISVISGQGIQIHFMPRELMETIHWISSFAVVGVLVPHILYSRKS